MNTTTPLCRRLPPALAALAAVPLLAGCLDKSPIATVPDAENQLFTPGGRLIVTGGVGVYEITPAPAGGYQASAIAADVNGACNYVGLAQIGDWVFTACQQKANLFSAADNHLLAARVAGDQPLHFVQVARSASPDPMDGLMLPNGMAVAPGGQLLLADTHPGLKPDGAIARVTLDFSGPVPRVAQFEPRWLDSAHGLAHPNGVRVSGNELFVTDLGVARRYQFDAAGNVPATLAGPYGPVPNQVKVYQGATVLDDVWPICGGLAINDYLVGRLIYMAPAGLDGNGLPTYRQAWASGPLSLQQPSSVQVGQAPMFSGSDVLVTEKGVIGDESSGYGNRLSRVASPIDLNDPASCSQLNGGGEIARPARRVPGPGRRHVC